MINPSQLMAERGSNLVVINPGARTLVSMRTESWHNVLLNLVCRWVLFRRVASYVCEVFMLSSVENLFGEFRRARAGKLFLLLLNAFHSCVAFGRRPVSCDLATHHVFTSVSIVCAEGSANVRIGLAREQTPFNVPHCIARHLKGSQASNFTMIDQVKSSFSIFHFSDGVVHSYCPASISQSFLPFLYCVVLFDIFFQPLNPLTTYTQNFEREEVYKSVRESWILFQLFFSHCILTIE